MAYATEIIIESLLKRDDKPVPPCHLVLYALHCSFCSGTWDLCETSASVVSSFLVISPSDPVASSQVVSPLCKLE